MKAFVVIAVVALCAMMGVMGASGVSMAQSPDGGAATVAPSGLTVSYRDGYVVLSWTRGTDSSYLEQIAMYREAGADPDEWHGGAMPTNLESIPMPRRFMQPGSTYIFKIAGAKLVNGIVEPVAYSNEVTFTVPSSGGAAPRQSLPPATATPELPAPAASVPAQPKPSGLSASVTDGAVILAWTPGTDARIVKQVVKRREPRVRRWTDVEVSVSANSYTDSTVQAGKRYIYRIQGQRSNGRGPISNVVRATVR